MATVAELKAANRAELDAIAVAQGIDPAEFSKVNDLRTELLKSADDADESNASDDPEGDESEGEGDKPTEQVNDGETAADKAEEPKTSASDHAPINFPSGFDATGQPIFGKKKADK